MDFLKNKMAKTDVQTGSNPEIKQADEGWMNAKQNIDKAIFELGKAYYEKNQDNPAPEYVEQIETIKLKSKEEYLWHQYRLNLEGQRLCDSCNSSITVDSAFCNRCGAKIEPIDFSPILDTSNIVQEVDEPDISKEAVCPECGKKLVEGAVFCEACGTRVG